MMIYGKCPTCQGETGFFSLYRTRFELALDKGEKINLKCKKCMNTNAVHVDDLYAKKSLLAFIVMNSVFFTGLALKFMVVSTHSPSYYILLVVGLGSTSAVIYYIMSYQEMNRVKWFNNNKLKAYNPKIKITR